MVDLDVRLDKDEVLTRKEGSLDLHVLDAESDLRFCRWCLPDQQKSESARENRDNACGVKGKIKTVKSNYSLRWYITACRCSLKHSMSSFLSPAFFLVRKECALSASIWIHLKKFQTILLKGKKKEFQIWTSVFSFVLPINIFLIFSKIFQCFYQWLTSDDDIQFMKDFKKSASVRKTANWC